jgi:putative Ca2+/H+ antiporter (TMEM165/GDT1 family)
LLAVVLGAAISRLVPASYIRIGAGVLFVLLGAWMIAFAGGK